MSTRVVIVGGGVVGLSIAYHVLLKGHRVTVLEQGGPEREGCSFANAGMVVPSHVVPLASPGMVALGLKWMWNPESPFHVAPRLSADLLRWGWKFHRACTEAHVHRAAPVLRDLHLASRAGFEEWAERWEGDFGLTREGLLVLCRTGHGLEEEARTAALAREIGIPAEVLSATATADLEPKVRMTVAGSVYFPLDCHLMPARLMTCLTREIDRAGGQVSYGSTVTGWRTAGDRIEAVRTSGGDVTADEYVVCAGVWSEALLRGLGLAIPMQAGKGYSLTLDTPPVTLRVPAILSEARVAVTPMGSAVRFGGTMELTGVNEAVNPARVRGIVKSLPRYYPDVTREHFERVPVRCGLRPCSPDGLPYLGRFRRFANLSVGTAHAMMGVSLAPITGKLIAEIVSGEPPSCPIEALSPDRYA